MHIQVRSSTDRGGFDEGEPREIAASQEFQAGTLLEMLGVLRDGGFNLRAAGGPSLELGGEFAFWVDQRGGDKDHDEAAFAAAKALQDAGWDAWTETVHPVILDDRPGTLREELERVAAKGLLVEEILVGTPGEDTNGRIPVQLRLARLAPR